jgi:hypothetical protein
MPRGRRPRIPASTGGGSAHDAAVVWNGARYSRYCRVYAPIYRQLTLSGIGNPSVSPEIRPTAYADVRAAWRTYLRKLGRGRGVVLIALGNLEELVRAQAKLWVKRYG